MAENRNILETVDGNPSYRISEKSLKFFFWYANMEMSIYGPLYTLGFTVDSLADNWNYRTSFNEGLSHQILTKSMQRLNLWCWVTESRTDRHDFRTWRSIFLCVERLKSFPTGRCNLCLPYNKEWNMNICMCSNHNIGLQGLESWD
jgi:hypothetical protein